MVRRLLALAALLSALFATVRARADSPTLSGTWSASGMSESWSTEDWGDACGPKPAPGGTGGGVVRIIQNGSELSMSGAGRAFSTSECWEQMPGMGRTGHSGGSRGWQTTCATPANDARQARVLTTIAATDNSISIRETGNYRWVVKGQTCAASVLRSRTLTLTQREGEAPPPAATSAAPTSIPAKLPPRCGVTPGEPARLEVHPGRKVLKPGDRFGFRAVVVDAEGCPIAHPPTWHIAPGPIADKITLEPTGALSVADDAPEGHAEISVAVGDAHATVALEIASAANYDALLALRSDAGDDETVVAVIAAGSIGGSTGVASDAAKQRKTTFVVVVFGIAACLGFIGLILARRGKHAPRTPARTRSCRPSVRAKPHPRAPPRRSPHRAGSFCRRARPPRPLVPRASRRGRSARPAGSVTAPKPRTAERTRPSSFRSTNRLLRAPTGANLDRFALAKLSFRCSTGEKGRPRRAKPSIDESAGESSSP